MQFRISTLLWIIVAVSAVMAMFVADPLWQFGCLTIVGVNIFGLAVGWFMNRVMNFPTDGGYRDPEIRAEMKASSKPKLKDD